MTRQLDLLDGGQLAQQLSGDLRCLLLEELELCLNRAVRLREFTQVAHPIQEFDDRFLKRQNNRHAGVLARTSKAVQSREGGPLLSWLPLAVRTDPVVSPSFPGRGESLRDERRRLCSKTGP